MVASARRFQTVSGCPCVDFETATGQFDFTGGEAYFNGEKVLNTLSFLSPLTVPSDEGKRVLGETAGDEKWIEVDLSEQKLKAWEGDRLFLESLVSSGKPSTPTITGEFRIWIKFQYANMSGGEKGTKSYYFLPNVPYIMYYHKSYGLHGAYWHTKFGQVISHGCVNLPIPVAERLFYWTTPELPAGKTSVRSDVDHPGTRVVVHK